MKLNNNIWKQIIKRIIRLMIIIFFIIFSAYLVSNADYTLQLRSPIVFQNPFSIQRRVIHLSFQVNYAKAEELQKAIDVKPNIKEYILGKFGKDGQIALAIVKAESSLRCNAIGDRNLNPKSYGLFQIRAFKGRPPVNELLDCYTNIDTAHKIYQTQGFNPWSTYKSGKYKKFLNK